MKFYEIFSQLTFGMVNFCLPIYFTFTCVNPDPYSQYGSGSYSKKSRDTVLSP